jgi:hypothetical protein
MHKDPESARKTDGLTVFFALLGFDHVKAARKMLVKSTPDLCVVTRITHSLLS